MSCYLAQSRDQIEQDEEDRGEAERLGRADGDQEDAVTGDSEEHQDLQTAWREPSELNIVIDKVTRLHLRHK